MTSKVELYIVLPCPQDMFRKQCVASVEVWAGMDKLWDGVYG